MNKLIYALLYYMIIAIVVLKTAKYYKFRNTNNTGKYIFLTNLCGISIIFCYCFTLLTNDYFLMSFGHSLTFVFIDFTLIFFYQYALEFTENKSKSVKYIVYALYAFAIVDSAVLISNPWHETALSYSIHVTDGGAFLIYEPRLWYLIHLAFSYITAGLAFVKLIMKCFSTPIVYITKYLYVFAQYACVLIFNFIYLNVESMYVDFSMITYAVLSAVIYRCTFNYRPSVMLIQTRKLILNSINTPVVLFDYHGYLLDLNDAAKNIFSISHSDIGYITIYDFMKNRLNNSIIDISRDSIFTYTNTDSMQYYHVDHMCLHDKKSRYIGNIFMFQNITELRNSYSQISQLATYDTLTGLYNKQVFQSIINENDIAQNLPLCVAVCNLNSLKLINDLFGYELGDKVLSFSAGIIKSMIRPGDYAGRLLGEETVVIMKNTTEEQAHDIMENICQYINSSKKFNIEISIEYGIAIKEKPDSDINEIINIARNSMYKKKMLNTSSVRSALIESLKESLSASDFETEEHVERTRDMAYKIGKVMNLPDSVVNDLALLAILHDIGKLSIPHDLLTKPSRLTDEEMEIMKLHTVKGFQIASTSPDLKPIAYGVLYHHEKWNGTGYPKGLKGEDIPLIARIISVIDSHDVMTHDRPYHKAMSQEDAIKELRRCSGTQFDPYVVKIFTEMLEKDKAEHIA